MMTFNRVSPVCLLLCLAVLVHPTDAQVGQFQNTATPSSGGYGGDATGYARAGSFSGSMLFGNDGGTYFLFDKMIGNGPGYTNGYSRFGLRAKVLDFGSSHFWGGGYALITDDTRVGVNVGGGYRWLYDANIIGVHGWYDSYQTNNGNRYDQVSGGLELLHEQLDLRINGYLPLNQTENFLRVTDPGTQAVFTPRGIGFLGHGLDEQALKGLDAEIGSAIFGVNWARVYGGGYWYEGKNTDFGGVRGRVEAAVSPDLSLNFIAQNDSQFDTNLQLSVEYRFSGAVSPGLFTPFHGESRKYNPVRRQWPIATQVVEIDKTIPLLNPMTGRPLTITFVDNRNTQAGDGSFENPYKMLPSSDGADDILVFAGTGPTTGNITLRDYQQLLGEGKLYTFNDPVRGTVVMPEPFMSTGPRPLLEAADPSKNIITLADHNRVASFDILGPTTAAIGGTDINSFQIEMVAASGVTDGIHIDNASGRGSITDSAFSVSDQGIFVSNTTGGPLDLSIQRGVGTITTIGGREGIHIVADGADVHLAMDHVGVDNATETGIRLDAAHGVQLTADVDEARVRNTLGVSGDGFGLHVDSGASMDVAFTNIGARGQGDLFAVDVHNGEFVGTVGGGTPGIVAGGDFSDSTGGSGVRLNLDNATGSLAFNGLFANRNAVDGIESNATGAGTDFFLSVVNSRTNVNIGKGVDLGVTGGADFRYFHDPSFAIMNHGDGLAYDVSGAGSVFVADILQTDFSGNGGNAINGRVADGAYANVDLTATPALTAGLNGYNLVVERNARFVGTIDQAQFNGSGDSAIDLTIADGSSANLTMSNIQAHSNGDYGLRYLVEGGANGGSSLLLGITNADFNTNSDSNIVGTSRGAGSNASVYLTNVTADGQASAGSVVLRAEDGGVLNQNWNTGSISQGLGGGVVARVDGAGSQIRMNYDNVSIRTNSGGDGIDGSIVNGGAGSVLDLTLVNSNVSQNGDNGIDLSLDGPGARSTVVIDNTPVAGNFGGDGLEFDVTNGAGLGVTASGAATNFAGNTDRAWDGHVSGAGSFATLNVDGADAVGAGLEGGRFEVTSGGLFNLNLSNLSISNNNLDGLLTIVDGAGSRANLSLDQVVMNHNGLSLVGDAFEARATNGGRIAATLTNMTVTENREDAFLFTSDTGSLIQTTMGNIVADNNGRHGLEYRATGGGRIEMGVSGGSFSNNGTVFLADGVVGVARDAGSTSSGVFDGVVADNNSRMGFEFDVRNGATLLGEIHGDGAFGPSSGSGNTINGVRFNALDAGTMAFLKMSGPNAFNDNGADGVNYDADGVSMAVANVSGSASDNGADGINVRMVNVGQGAISLQGGGTGQITGNGDDGIDITTQNVALVDKTVNGMLIQDFQIDGFTITGNGGEPIVVNMTNTTMQHGEITNNIIDGGQDGINVHLGAGNGDLLVDNNVITGAARYGIAVTSDVGTHNVTITNNSVTSSGDTNIYVDLYGNTQTGLMINDNTLIGGGTGMATFTTGLNFQGSTSLDSGFIPPDTMGAVGPNQVVELLNGTYAVYDKSTGAEVFRSSLDDFFTAAGLPNGPAGSRFDPRIIYDPTVDRWFASAIDGGVGNSIYIAVSKTDNPLDGFEGVSFVGDTVDGTRFDDFDTMGVDANGLYLATNNFDASDVFQDVSIFSIPKADLLGAVPSVANLSRQEALDGSVYGFAIQPAVNFGPAGSGAHLLSANGSGSSQLQLMELTGTATPTATLSGPQAIPVATYFRGPNARQPAAPPLDNVSPRINGNVVEVGGHLWGVHAVRGSSGNSAIRWYEIDAATGTVLQTGDIEDPNVDYIDGSIAVNPLGAVMIGFTGSGPGQNPSSMAAFGSTAGGVTTFQTPTVLQTGNTSYFQDFGTGRNRWGDYSATVVDPSNPNKFWTFQELAVGPSTWGVQVTEVNFTQAVFGGTANDGIHVNVRDHAHLLDSTINGNSAVNHGGDGIEVSVADMARVDHLTINDNTNLTDNGGDGVHVETTGTNLVAGLSINGNSNVSGNMGDGIEVDLKNLKPASVPDVHIDGNSVSDSMGRGIVLSALNSSLGDVSVAANIVQNNVGGAGISIDMKDQIPGVVTTNSINVSMNTVSESAGDGISVNLTDISGIQSFDMNLSNLIMNSGAGLSLNATRTPISMIRASTNTIVDNTGGDGMLIHLDHSGADLVSITSSNIEGNSGDGIDLDLDASPVGMVNIADNDAGMGTAAGTLSFDFTNLIWTTFQDNNSDPGFNIAQTIVDINPVGQGWRPDLNPLSPGRFQPQGGTDVTVGLTAVNGNAITPGTDPLEDAGGSPLLNGGVTPGSQVLTLDFGDFNPGERLHYELAHSLLGSNALESGTTLNGSLVTAVLEDGRSASGMISSSGMTISQFLPGTTGGISGNMGDGVRISAANGSNIGGLHIDGNLIDSNLDHGVNLLISDSTLPVTVASVSGNTITNHANGDGIRLVNPDTNGTPISIDFVDNTISGNTGGMGLNVQLNADSGGMTSTVAGNTISGNGSLGASFAVTDNANLDLKFGDSAAGANALGNNVNAGLAITTADDSTATISIENTTISGTTTDGTNPAFDGSGLAVHSSGNSIVNAMTIGNDTLKNTSFTGNASAGIQVALSDNARNPNMLIQNVAADDNLANGIGIVRAGFSTFSEDLNSNGVLDAGEDVNGDGLLGHATITRSTADGNAGNGLNVAVNGASQPLQQIEVDQSSFSGNTIGMNFVVGNNSSLLVDAANNTINGNSSHGVNVTTNQNAAFGNVFPSAGNPNSPLAVPSTFSSNIVTGNGGNGFNFVANDNSVQVVKVDDAGAVNPSTGNSRSVIDGNTGNGVQITGNGMSQQNVNLTAVQITNVNGVATGDGVNVDANGTSTVKVAIKGGASGASIIGATMATLAQPGLGGNGIAASTADQAILNLNVENVKLFHNAGDAINIRNAGPGAGTTGTAQRQTIQATFDNVDARLSGDRGLDVLLTGNVGGRAAQGDADIPVLIDVKNSVFSSNTNEGVFFRAAPGFTQGTDNLYADQVSTFNVVDSMIQSNGNASITDGLVMEIGTNAYVLSTISGNMFGANGQNDFSTSSFDSGGDPNSAELDLAFQDNSGDHIRPTALGTTTGATLFILDNALSVEANNDFQKFGVPQMEVFGPDGFSTNGYILRPLSNHGDPLFP